MDREWGSQIVHVCPQGRRGVKKPQKTVHMVCRWRPLINVLAYKFISLFLTIQREPFWIFFSNSIKFCIAMMVITKYYNVNCNLRFPETLVNKIVSPKQVKTKESILIRNSYVLEIQKLSTYPFVDLRIYGHFFLALICNN